MGNIAHQILMRTIKEQKGTMQTSDLKYWGGSIKMEDLYNQQNKWPQIGEQG